MGLEFRDIKDYSLWSKIERIDYGWSFDTKYYIEDKYGEKYLLRISDICELENKKKEFSIIKKFNQLDITMSKAIEIGVCNNNKNVYILLSWVEGESMREIISTLPKDEQYKLGIEAGKILKRIHSISVDEEDISTETKISKKLLQLESYENSAVRIPNDEIAINYVKNKINRICKLPSVYKHGDFHLGNLIYTNNKQVGVIDFNRWRCGDRYGEFYKLQSFNVEESIPYCIGQIHGYFNGEPPNEFWEAQAVYVAHASLYSIKWAEKFGKEDVDGMTKRCLEAFYDYDDFKKIIPRWYEENSKDYMIIK